MTGQANPARGGAARWLMWSFAAIGLLAALAVIFLAITVLGFMSGGPREPARVAGKAPSEQYSVQDVDGVRGTDLLQIQIGIGEHGGGSYSGKRSIDQRNLILLNRLNGESRRLLPDNSRSIERTWLFPAVTESPAEAREAYEPGGEVTQGAKSKAPPPPFAYYVLAVRQEGGRLEDVLVGDLATGHQAFVLSGIDGIDRIWMASPTRVAILLREKLRLHYRVIDIPALKVVTARPVDIG
jgi:hypothetical protein